MVFLNSFLWSMELSAEPRNAEVTMMVQLCSRDPSGTPPRAGGSLWDGAVRLMWLALLLLLHVVYASRLPKNTTGGLEEAQGPSVSQNCPTCESAIFVHVLTQLHHQLVSPLPRGVQPVRGQGSIARERGQRRKTIVQQPAPRQWVLRGWFSLSKAQGTGKKKNIHE